MQVWRLSPEAYREKGAGEPADLSDQEYKFSHQEPCINRYVEGGLFPSHSDRYALTVNILLAVGAFEGGGTHFWTEDSSSSIPETEPTLLVLPSTAGMGLLFNGTVRHAGREVTAGIRHLLVASFCIADGPYATIPK